MLTEPKSYLLVSSWRPVVSGGAPTAFMRMRTAPRNPRLERQGSARNEGEENLPGALARESQFRRDFSAAGWDPYEVWRTRVRTTHVAHDVMASLLPDGVDSDNANLPVETRRVGALRRFLCRSWVSGLRLILLGSPSIEPGTRRNV